MDQKYSKGDSYEINADNSIIKVPVPFSQDYKCFKAEFLDIIMPSLVKESNMIQPFLEGSYEYNEVIINKGDTVLDIGANFGLFSSLASSRGCDVYAFEPTPRIIDDYLSRQKEINPNITVIP